MRSLLSGDIRGNWATVLASWNQDGSLDLGRVGAQIDVIVSMGVDGMYCHGTAGEFHAQTEQEFDRIAELLATKCETAGMAFQIGVAHMSAQISLGRLRRAAQLRPAALQVILPDWFPVTPEEASIFLARMAEAAEGIGLILYNPPHAKVVLSPEEITSLAKSTPGLVGVKTAGGNDAWYQAMQENFSRLSVFVPGHMLASGVQRGAHGSYSNVACLHPAAAQRWADQMQHDMPAALELEGRIQRFMGQYIMPFITHDRYCNAACDRLLALIGGWADVGEQMRWPYKSIPAFHAVRIRDSARELLPEFFSA
jgi:dihydrodipicolinate synthase/N-acetylneuraminate lyase